MVKKINNKGSEFDLFLESEGILAEAELIAIKRVIAWKFKESMKEQRITKVALANKMKTSRAVVDRLLDPNNTSLTLRNLERAATVLHKKLRIEFEDYAN